MAVSVLTDSAAALPREVAANQGIVVVPLWLNIGGTALKDDQVSQADIIARYEEGISTSGPSPGEWKDAIGSCIGADGAVICTVTGTLGSSTARAAEIAAADFGGTVRIVDTRTAAGAQALVAIAAASSARAGGSLDDVERVSRIAADEVRLVAMLDTLDYLVRSRRIPGLAGWAGRQARLKPLFEFDRGEVRKLRPAFGRDAAVQRMLGACQRSEVKGARLHAVAMHALDEGSARRLIESIHDSVASPETSYVAEFSPVMVSYTGPGLLGLAWRWEEQR